MLSISLSLFLLDRDDTDEEDYERTRLLQNSKRNQIVKIRMNRTSPGPQESWDPVRQTVLIPSFQETRVKTTSPKFLTHEQLHNLLYLLPLADEFTRETQATLSPIPRTKPIPGEYTILNPTNYSLLLCSFRPGTRPLQARQLLYLAPI